MPAAPSTGADHGPIHLLVGSTTRPDSEPEPVARSAGRVSLATGLSRVGGLLREAVFAALFGGAPAADAFVMAFRIPNLLREFFAEGALSSAFVPTFTRLRAVEGDARAFALARRTMGTLGLVTGVIALLGIVFAPAVVAVVAPDATAETKSLTISLTRIMFPFLPLVALAAVAMGVLNTHRRYFVPALAPAFFNLVAILGGSVLLFAYRDRPEDVEAAIAWWSILVVLGGLAQLLLQVPLLIRVGWRGPPVPDLGFRDPALRVVAGRMAPVLIALAGTNVMLVIVTALASRGEGWPAWLNYAFRLVHLPIGLVGVAVGTVLLAAGARQVAAGDERALDGTVGRGLRLTWLLALPAAVGLAVLAEPLVRLLYERGRFGPGDTLAVAAALRAYAVGIVFYAGVKAAAPLYLARGDTRTPMLCSLGGIAVTVVAAFLLVAPLGYVGLALAVAFGSATNYVGLRAVGRRRFGPGSSPGWGFLLRIAVAALAMGVVGFLVARRWLLGDGAVASPWWAGALTLALTVGLALLYFVAATGLGVEEVGALRRRLGLGGPNREGGGPVS